MNDLKPCPFCGNEVEVEKIPMWYGNGRGYSGCHEFKIKCKSCGCTVDQPKNDSIYRSEEKARENAIEAWNRRTKDDKNRSREGDTMDEYKAIEDVDDLVNGRILADDHGELLEKIRVLLKLAKQQIGYCEVCRIRYEDDSK